MEFLSIQLSLRLIDEDQKAKCMRMALLSSSALTIRLLFVLISLFVAHPVFSIIATAGFCG